MKKTETLKVAVGTDKFTFAWQANRTNQSFTIAVTAPDGQSCSSSVTQGSIVNANITDVEIVCVVATYSVSGSVTGAVDDSQLTITLSHADAGTPPANIVTMDVTPNTDGTYSFDVPENRIYLLSVTSATTDEVCTPDVATFSAPITANVTNADIVCEPAAADTYTIGGAVSGLAKGDVITLTLTPTGSNAEIKVITADAEETAADDFVFNARLVSGDTYTVTTTSPTGKTCTVDNAGTQMIADANVTDVAVTCVINTYSISGTVSGLAKGDVITLTLTPTGGNAETKVVTGDDDETANDPFAFDTAIAYDTPYEVTTSSPAGKTCRVAPAGSQTIGDADVTDISVTCGLIPTHSISGTVRGLAADGETVTLTLTTTDGAAETKDVVGDTEGSTDDAFTFDTKLVAGASYTITTTSTVQKTCRVVPAGEQIMGDADVTDIVVICELTYYIRGKVSGAG